VRGVEPVDICYDSATNCVYTANRASGSVSVFDCAGDTLLRLEAVGREPYAIITGPPGKAYCANYGDSSVSVITDSGVKTVRTRRYPRSLSYDSVNNKVYCSGIGSGQNTSSVTVVDASVDTVTAQLAVAGPTAVCWNPIGNSTYATSPGQDYVSVIGGVSDTVEAVIAFVVCSPGPLCYNSVNNHLYCLDQNNDLLFIIDGDSNRVLKTLKTPATGGSDTLVWNPVSNKVYFTNSYDGTVSIVDCMGDSMVATVEMGGRSYALCSSDDGKVYVANISSCVAVIDGLGDSVRAVVPTGGEPRALCYDRIDNKVYVGGTGERVVHVIDVAADSLVATISIPWMFETGICWNPNHDKAYVSGSYCDTLVVIDCAGDTMLRKFDVYTNLYGLHSDSVCDKVYGFDSERGYLRVFSAAADTAICNLSIGSGSAILDNGKQGPANRLYCATTTAPKSQRSAGTRWTASSVASAWEASRQPSLGTRSTRASTCRIEAVRASV
jgi:YVTN family beta-propeller protein